MCSFYGLARYGYLLAALFAAGCASNVPREISEAPASEPDFVQVRSAPGSYLGQTVRWGGVIAAVENRASETRIEVVQKALHRSGHPLQGDQSEGRFVAIVSEFLDPALFTQNRSFTVVGEVGGNQSGTIGDFAYEYPVVNATHYQLWPKPLPRRDRRPRPYWHDPWYDPWYGPWYRPGRSHYHPHSHPRRHQARQIQRQTP